MLQRGRKSSALVAVPLVDQDPLRLQPPSDLTKAERTLFMETVRNCAPSHFVQADLPMLVSYVQWTLAARRLAHDPKQLEAWEKATKLQYALARSLRLTVQSRATRRSIARRMPELNGPRPWESY